MFKIWRQMFTIWCLHVWCLQFDDRYGSRCLQLGVYMFDVWWQIWQQMFTIWRQNKKLINQNLATFSLTTLQTSTWRCTRCHPAFVDDDMIYHGIGIWNWRWTPSPRHVCHTRAISARACAPWYFFIAFLAPNSQIQTRFYCWKYNFNDPKVQHPSFDL